MDTREQPVSPNQVSIRVLIVEDAEDDALLVVRALRRGGYEPEWERVDTAEAMQHALGRQRWDVIVSDYHMPHFSALAALKVLHGGGWDLPFIVVSGSIGEEMAVAAMKAGVHDYIMKDNLARLVVAIEREMRDADGRRLRRRAESQVRSSLREKNILLKELHHRVKNNLQVVASLLHLGSRTITDDRSLHVFEEARARIKSIALVHEKLYQSPDFAGVDLSDYLSDVAAHACRSYGSSSNPPTIECDFDGCVTTVDVAIPCGLIVNELVSNATKYAFPGGRKGVIRLSLKRDPEGGVRLSVSDTGIGFPPGLDLQNPRTLGLQLVLTLTEQLGGTASFDRQDGGGRVTIAFTEDKLLKDRQGDDRAA